MSLNDFLECVNIYVSEMITDYMINEMDTPPQTTEDYMDCLEYILSRGIMGNTGIGRVTIHQFYDLENGNILERVSPNVFDDILESVNNSILFTRYPVPIDPTNLTQICELYINSDLYTTIQRVTVEVRERVEIARQMMNESQQ
jgi:hypothetical protein